MAYTLSKSNGATLILLNDGLVDTSVSSLNLIGKNVSNFGDAQNENFLFLLENFAKNTEPRSPLQGQIWFDSSTNVFRPAVYDGGNWRSLAVLQYSNTTTDTVVNAGGANFVASQPGDLWFNSSSKQLHIVSGPSSETTLIGPEGVYGFDTTKLSSVKIKDTLNADHAIVEIILDGEVIGILSKDTFTPSVSNPISGFSKINRGLTFKNYSSGTRYSTSSTDVVLHGLHEQLDTSYPRRNVNENIQSSWTFNDSVKLYFGTNNEAYIDWNDLAHKLNIVSNGTVKVGNVNHELTFGATEITPATNGTISLGNTFSKFNNLYAATLNAGSGVSALTGEWTLSNGSKFTPVTDLSNVLGSTSARFSTVYTTGISAFTSATTISVVGSPSVSGNITPSITNNSNLGSNLLKWNTVYATNANITALAATTLNFTSLVDTATTTITKFDTDTALAADSNSRLPTQHAVKTFVDDAITVLQVQLDNFPSVDPDGTLSANSNTNISTQKAVKTYVDTAVSALNNVYANRYVPTGAVFHVVMSTAPTGFLVCNGAGVSRTFYPDLFAAIGYSFGGSGNTFNLPDLRGEFIRGWDNGRGIDIDRTLGSAQADMFGTHNHGMPGDDQLSFSSGYHGWAARSRGGFPYDSKSNFGGGAQVWDTTDEGGVETRPRNIALLPIIKT